MSGSVDTATLQLTVDTTSVDKGKQSLADFQAQAALTESAVNTSNAKIASGFDAIKQGTSGTAQAYQSLSDQIAATNQANADREIADAAKLQQIQIQNYKQMFDEIAAAEKAAAAQRAADALAAEQASDDAILAARTANQAKLDAIRAAEGPGGFTNTNPIPGITAEQALAQKAATASAVPVTTDAEHEADLARDAYMAEAQAAILAASGVKSVETAASETSSGVKSAAAEVDNLSNSFTINSRQARAVGSDIRGLATGNFNQLEGSLISTANQFGLLQKVLSPVGLLISGTAVAIGLVTAAMVEGESEQNKYNAAMALTGNAAGIAEDNVENLAKSYVTAGTSIGTAIDTLTKLAESGKYTSDQIYLITQASTQMAAATGQSVDSFVADFAKIADNPTKALLSLDEQYHFLTASTLLQVEALQQQGDKTDAVTLATKTFADAETQALKDAPTQIGLVASAWDTVRNNISAAKQAVEDWGKTDTLGSLVAKDAATLADDKQSLGSNVRNSDGSISKSYSADDQAQIAQDQQIYDNAKRLLDTQTDMTNQMGQQKALQTQAIQDMQTTVTLAESHNKELEKTNALAAENARYANIKNQEQNPKNGFDPATDLKNHNDAIQAINERYKTPNTQKAQQSLDIAPDAVALKQAAADEAASFAQLKSLRDSDSIDSLTYYKDQVTAITTWQDATVAAYAKEAQAVQANMGTGAQEIESKKKLIQITGDEAAAKTKATQQISEASAEYVKSIIAEENEITKFAAAQDKSLRDQQQKNSDTEYTAGLGGDAATNASAILAINNKLASDLESIDAKYGANKDGFYQQDVAKAKETNAEKLADEQQHEQKMLAINSSYTVGIQKGYQDFLKSANDVADQTANITNSALTGIASNFAQLAVTGKANWKDLTTSILEDLAKMEIEAVEAKALQALVTAGGGGGDGGFSLSGVLNLFGGGGYGSQGAYAKGGVFDQGNVVPMRTGGIVDSATIVPMSNGSALMGEAGPEAVIPLKRTADGRLGVAGGSGGGSSVQQNVSVEVHNYGQEQATVTQSGQGTDKLIKVVIGAVANDITRGGATHKAIQTKYNVTQKGQRF